MGGQTLPMMKQLLLILLLILFEGISQLGMALPAGDEWTTSATRIKLTDSEKQNIELVLAHEVIELKPKYYDISKEFELVRLPKDSPERKTFISGKHQFLSDYAILPSSTSPKAIIFSYDEAETTRISVCGDRNCTASRIANKPGKDVGDAAWFPDNVRVAFAEDSVYGIHPGIWVWDTETQASSQIIKPSDLHKSERDTLVFSNISVSPDGNSIWFALYPDPDNTTKSAGESWTYSLLHGALTKVESDRNSKSELPFWSKDGTTLKIGKKVYVSNGSGVFEYITSTPDYIPSAPLILGVLEHNLGEYAGQPSYHAIRVVFKSTDSGWVPFKDNCGNPECLKTVVASYPPTVSWIIAFDGKRIGALTSRNPNEIQAYCHVGRQDINKSDAIPLIGKPSNDFAGFASGPVYRPLIAVSRPYYQDPDKWKPTKLSSDTTKGLIEMFRKKFPTVLNCEKPEDIAPKQWDYSDSDIKVEKAYSSLKHWAIAQLRLHESRCDGPPDEPFHDQWFYISPDGKVNLLGEGMLLVDAGDYNNDGESELVFMIDRYNRGGYEIYWDNFTQHAVFEFGYH